MDQSFTRGAAVAAFALGTLAAFGPASAQVVSAGPVRPARDSVVVRVIETNQKLLIDSVMVIMRALDNEPPMSDQAFTMRRRLEEMMRGLAVAGSRGRGMGGTLTLRAGSDVVRDLESRHVRGWIGISTGNAPHEEFSDSNSYFVRYLRYPEIISVEPNSPAQRAGITPGDVLVAYDGLDVTRRIDVGQLFVPERRMAVTVQREGESKEFSMVVAKTPMRIMFRRNDEPGELPLMPPDGPAGGMVRRAAPARRPDQSEQVFIVGTGGFGGGGSVGAVPFVMGRSAVFGAALMTVGSELARVLKVEKGVLIQECPESTPAFRAGLRVGDVIVSVDGQPATAAAQVQSVAFAKRNEKSLTFQVIRDKKPVSVTLKTDNR